MGDSTILSKETDILTELKVFDQIIWFTFW